MGVLKFHRGPPCPTLVCPAGGPPPKQPYSGFREARPQSGQPASSTTRLDTPRRAALQEGL
jgi:hypothetical protein